MNNESHGNLGSSREAAGPDGSFTSEAKKNSVQIWDSDLRGQAQDEIEGMLSARAVEKKVEVFASQLAAVHGVVDILRGGTEQ